MTKQILKSIDDLEARRRELDRQIRAAKRAEKKAALEALSAAQQHLGVEVAEAVGADSLDAVKRLRVALMSGQMQGWLRQQVGSGSQGINEAGAASSGATGNVVGGGHDAVA